MKQDIVMSIIGEAGEVVVGSLPSDAPNELERFKQFLRDNSSEVTYSPPLG